MENNSYSEKIKQLRKESAWTQEQLAAVAQVSSRTIQRIEAGKNADPDTLMAIADAFGMDVRDFLRTPEQGKGNEQDSQEKKDTQNQPTQDKKRLSPSIIFLLRTSSGEDLSKAVGAADAGAFEHDDLTSQGEVDLVSTFLQELKDYMDIWGDIEPKDRVQATYDFTVKLQELEDADFWTFVGQHQQKCRFEDQTTMDMTVAYVYILRSSNPVIVKPDDPRKALKAVVPVKLPDKIRLA